MNVETQVHSVGLFSEIPFEEMVLSLAQKHEMMVILSTMKDALTNEMENYLAGHV